MKHAKIFLAWMLVLCLTLGVTVLAQTDDTPLTVTQVVEQTDGTVQVHFSEPVTLLSRPSDGVLAQMSVVLLNQDGTAVMKKADGSDAKWERNASNDLILSDDGTYVTLDWTLTGSTEEVMEFAYNQVRDHAFENHYSFGFMIRDLSTNADNGYIDYVVSQADPNKKLTAGATYSGTDCTLFAGIETGKPYLTGVNKISPTVYQFHFSEPISVDLSTSTGIRPGLYVINKTNNSIIRQRINVNGTEGTATVSDDRLSILVDYKVTSINDVLNYYMQNPNDYAIEVRILGRSGDADRFVDGITDASGHQAYANFKNSAGADALTWDVTDRMYPHVKVGDTPYDSMDEALEAASKGDTLTLYRDMAYTSQPLLLPAGITLDLNGHILHAPQFIAFGYVLDSKNGQGLLGYDPDTGADFVFLQQENTQLPVYDRTNKGYRFFDYDIINCGTREVLTENTVTALKYGIRLAFTNPDAYHLLQDAANTDLTLTLHLTVRRPNSSDTTIRYTFSNRILSAYANAVLNGNGNTLVLKVNGIDVLAGQMQSMPISATMDATSSVTSGTGVTYDSTQKLYHVGITPQEAAVNWIRSHIINKDLISFTYNGTPANLSNWTESISGQATSATADWTQIRTYKKDGITLTITISFDHVHAALEWVADWNYDGSDPSKRISDVRILNAPFDIYGAVMTTANQGGQNYVYDYQPYSVDLTQTASYTMQNSGGRSSQGAWPYFDLTSAHNTYGIMGAIGWSGNWNCQFTYENGAVHVSAGMQNTNYQMKNGEHLRTPSMVIQFFKGTQDDGHNAWRQLVLEQYTPEKRNADGSTEKVTYAPISVNTWGGQGTDSMLTILNNLKNAGQYFEYHWIDAGWYGNTASAQSSDGIWQEQLGNWYYNPGYADLNGKVTDPDSHLYLTAGGFDALQKWHQTNNTDLIVWFEPARAMASSQMGSTATSDNPFTFKATYKPTPDSEAVTETVTWTTAGFLSGTSIVDYGNQKALAFTKAVVLHYLDDMGCYFYRQDYNCNPANGWKNKDTNETTASMVRTGVAEIKYVMGHYELLDAILASGRQIDNCASGGRLLDIEMMKRSIPLWRTDYTVSGSSVASGIRSQGANLSWWLPISGGSSSSQGISTAYGFRSYMASGATMGLLSNQTYAKKMINELLYNRELMLGDYYILQQGLHEGLALGTDTAHNNITCWLEEDSTKDYTDSTNAAYEFYQEDRGEGYLVAFRPTRSTDDCDTFTLKGLDAHARYEVRDADSGETAVYTGRYLMEHGLKLQFPSTLTSRMIYFTKQ